MRLALPPLPRKYHGMGGQGLRHIDDKRDRVVAELRCGVRGHQEVMPWPGVVSCGIQTLQGAPHLGRRWRGVSAIPEPGDCTREMRCRSP